MMRGRLLVLAVSLVGICFFVAPTAHSAGVYNSACTSAATWSANQCDSSINDDGTANYGNFSTACYGACGPGCSSNCGSGGACGSHDYLTRTYGMWSSQAMGAFPDAAAQWGKCVMGAGYTYASGSMKSAWSGIKKNAGKLVSSIFN